MDAGGEEDDEEAISAATLRGKPRPLPTSAQSAFSYVPPRRLDPKEHSYYFSPLQTGVISLYDCIFRQDPGYNQKLHRDDREHARGLGLHVNQEVRLAPSSQPAGPCLLPLGCQQGEALRKRLGAPEARTSPARPLAERLGNQAQPALRLLDRGEGTELGIGRMARPGDRARGTPRSSLHAQQPGAPNPALVGSVEAVTGARLAVLIARKDKALLRKAFVRRTCTVNQAIHVPQPGRVSLVCSFILQNPQPGAFSSLSCPSR
ncbi:PREDICTED: uncharacterized protein C5orf49 homolog [Condylura cristata]|uniref:uncharacterized protein C5orf49 homolog n=1 Tax=Condylura cristata TaxID=143302 RepID=UPI0006439D4F|nr:PREDICTED: uncharacterized protein C5orf49 homolog [Condylura cristata]